MLPVPCLYQNKNKYMFLKWIKTRFLNLLRWKLKGVVWKELFDTFSSSLYWLTKEVIINDFKIIFNENFHTHNITGVSIYNKDWNRISYKEYETSTLITTGVTARELKEIKELNLQLSYDIVYEILETIKK